MLIEVHPEPTPEEREALLCALTASDGEQDRGSAWWDAGIRESVEEESEEF